MRPGTPLSFGESKFKVDIRLTRVLRSRSEMGPETGHVGRTTGGQKGGPAGIPVTQVKDNEGIVYCCLNHRILVGVFTY